MIREREQGKRTDTGESHELNGVLVLSLDVLIRKEKAYGGRAGSNRKMVQYRVGL